MKNLLNKVMLFLAFLALTSCSVESLEQEFSQINTPSEQPTNSVEQASNNYAQQSTNLSCESANPESRLVNNGTITLNFTIVDTETGEQFNVGEIAPGETSVWTEFNESLLVFSLSNQNEGIADIKIQVEMGNCMALELVLDNNNELTNSTPIDL